VTDPFEHGFEVAQRRRLDLPPEPTKEERKRWQRPGRTGWQVIVFALAIVLLLSIGKAVTARNATGLKGDCSRFQLAVAEKSVQSRGAALLHWATTAPAGTRFVVAIDKTGAPVTEHEQATPPQTMPSGCLAHGQFGVLVPPGTYRVDVFTSEGVLDRLVASHTVTVTAS
jgi:hypothetical protein